jgi:hypothetical protein
MFRLDYDFLMLTSGKLFFDISMKHRTELGEKRKRCEMDKRREEKG